MKRLSIAVLALALAASSGCDWLGDSIEQQSQTTTVIIAGPGPVPVATPTPGTGGGAVAAVNVSGFGTETGPGAIVAGPGVRVGNQQPITCTPKDAAGNDVPTAIHGPTPDRFTVVSGGQAVQLLAVSEPFNRDAVGLSAGTARVECEVHGVTGALDIQVLP
jgi:hypothetical protein